MSKKRSIILISIIVFITILFVVCSTVFRVNAQTVVFESEDFSKINAEQIVSSGEIKKGKSIFFLNKKSAKNKIEKNNPYAKVNKIEIKFPNKLVYHISQRSEFCYAYQNGEYLVFDDELKLLRTSEEEPSLIKINGVSVEIGVGDFLNNETMKNAFEIFEKKFVGTIDGVEDREFSLSNPVAISNIDEINFDNQSNSLTFKMITNRETGDGYSIKIVNDKKFKDKIVAFMGVLCENEAAPSFSNEEKQSNDVFELQTTSRGIVKTKIS